MALFAYRNVLAMNRNIETNLLRTFVTIADLGGVGRASERLHLAQPTVSLHIKRLEEQLDTKLFRREARGMTLTEQGHKLLRYARRILSLNDEALKSVGPSGLTGEVRFGVIQDLAETVLSDMVETFSREYPAVQLDLVVANSVEMESDLATGKLDIAVLAGDDSDQASPFMREPMVWIGSDRLSLEGQDMIPLVLCSAPCGIRQIAISLLEERNVPWRVAFISPSLQGVKAAVRAGYGVTLRGKSALGVGLKMLDQKDRLPTPPEFTTVVKRSPHSNGVLAVDEVERVINAFAPEIG